MCLDIFDVNWLNLCNHLRIFGMIIFAKQLWQKPNYRVSPTNEAYFLRSPLEAVTQRGLITSDSSLCSSISTRKPPQSNGVWMKSEAGNLCHLMNRDQWKISRQTHPLCVCHTLTLADPVLICAKPSHKTQRNEEHSGVKLKQYGRVLRQLNICQLHCWCTSRWITQLHSAWDIRSILKWQARRLTVET